MFNPILFRHKLHRSPELSGSEKRTHELLVKTLRTFGYSPIEDVGGHGVVVKIDSGLPGPHLLFRADTDALPINEIAVHQHSSEHDGIMHACGHDGHSASLMALAYRLSLFTLQRGTVTMIFQPSEENGQGALAMLSDKKWDKGKIDYAFGYHNVPGYPLGQILCRENTFACASTGVSITFKGKTAHAAYPESAINPTFAIRELMQDIDVLPITLGGLTMATLVHVNLGQPAFGTTPESGQLMVTLRSDSNKCFQQLCEGLEEKAKAYADRDGLMLDIDWDDNFNATINHSEANMLLKQACKDIGFHFADLNEPMRWSEDFSAYSAQWPSAFFGLGSGTEHPPLHDPHYDFPDTLIDISSKIFEQIIRDMNGLR
ncbi:hydrolase [Enterovibrio norvegicus]|uniref:amidohydrolase n=1 Tax=Enterovibrio norvegicus TaxID=188144 RepID=UPI000C8602DB|nr:amidohydrolase [Enterovibrio norvegicus]MCC4799449.1 amidohydrolase [Enterovibrio norvegicus]PMI34687.1 hydrolase [Enterovibrio norvegicus]PMI35696.1 hydrolase [Enterovibrio norvegicus]PMN54931.1 hydrolase [Enterovibrio norvegicus]TKF17648.1 amidohydrolase [Enterovibrio norvegicus]